MSKSTQRKNVYDEILAQASSWNDKYGLFQISLQKKQYEECLMTISQLVNYTNRIFELIASFPLKEHVRGIQFSILARLMLLYKDVLFNQKAFTGSKDFPALIQQAIIDSYLAITSPPVSFTSSNLLDLIYHMIASSSKTHEISTQQFIAMVLNAVEEKSMEIFEKESSKSLPLELLLFSGNLFLRRLDGKRINDDITNLFVSLSKAVDILVLNNYQRSNRGKSDSSQQYVSILARAMFDLFNLILPNLQSESSNYHALSVHIINGIITIIDDHCLKFSGKGLTYLSAICHRLGLIIQHLFSIEAKLEKDNNNNRQSDLQRHDVFFPLELFLTRYYSFLSRLHENRLSLKQADGSCFLSNSRELLDAITSITAIFVTQRLLLIEKKRVQDVPLLRLHLRVLVPTICLHTSSERYETSSNSSLNKDPTFNDLLYTNSSTANYEINPEMEKQHKLGFYFISLSVAILSQECDHPHEVLREDFETELDVLIRRDPMLHQFFCSYVLREINQKVLMYCRDSKTTALLAWKKLFLITYRTLWSGDSLLHLSKCTEELLSLEFHSLIESVIQHYGITFSMISSFQTLKEPVNLEMIQEQLSGESTTPFLKAWFNIKSELNLLQNKLRVRKQDESLAYSIKGGVLGDEERKIISSLFEEWERLFLVLEDRSNEKRTLFITILLNSPDLLTYFQWLTLSGDHQLQYRLYYLCSKQEDFFHRNPYYNADIVYCLRVQLCIHHYWNNYPASYFHQEKQLFNTKSNQNLIENAKSVIFAQGSNTSFHSEFSYNKNIFLSLEDYFYTSHQLLISSLPSSNIIFSEITSKESSDCDTAETFIERRISLQSHCNYLLSECRQFKSFETLLNNQHLMLMSQVNSLRSNFQLFAVNSWICLFFARILFFQFGEAMESLALCRQALNYCSIGTESHLMFFTWAHVRFETVLLITEVYDFLGKANRFQEYLSESLSLAKNFESFYQTYQMHSLRFFLRMQSSKLDSVLLDLLSYKVIPRLEEGSRRNKKSKGNLLIEKEKKGTFDAGSVIQQAIQSLLLVLPSIKERIKEQVRNRIMSAIYEEKSENKVSLLQEVAKYLEDFTSTENLRKEQTAITIDPLHFRFLYRYWGLTSDQISGNAFKDQMISNLDSVVSSFQYTLRTTSSRENQAAYSMFICPNNQLKDNSKSYSLSRILPYLHSHRKYNLQILKQLRKVMCATSIENAASSQEVPSSNEFSAFLYGASSLFLSSELSSLSLSSINNKDGSLFNPSGEMINNAIQFQDPLAKAAIELKLKSALTTCTEKGNCRLFFLSIDGQYQRALMGGMHFNSDCSSPNYRTYILSGELYKELLSLVSRWRTVIEDSDKSLHLYSQDDSQALTNEEKKNWWKARESIDCTMKQIIHEMNNLLAPFLRECLHLHEDEMLAPLKKPTEEDSVVTDLEGASLNPSYGDVTDQENCALNGNKVEAVHTFNPDIDLSFPAEVTCLEKMFEKKLILSIEKDDASTVSQKTTESFYENLKIPELKTKLKERGLSLAGKKSELVQRLLEHDKRSSILTSPKSRRNSGSILSPRNKDATKKAVNETSKSTRTQAATFQTKRHQAGMTLKSSKSDEKLTARSKSSSSASLRSKSSSRTISSSISSLSFHGEEDETLREDKHLRAKIALDDFSTDRESQSNDHLLIMLDETLQDFPFESLMEIKDWSTSRILSLPHLFQIVDDLHSKSESRSSDVEEAAKLLNLDRRKSSFVVDADNNLPDTRKVMLEFLSPFLEHYPWKVIAGRAPTEAEIRQTFKSDDFYIYCGHGSGETFLHKVDRDTSKLRIEEGRLPFPATLLFGCSSVKLQRRGLHEPTGALSYLLEKKAPFVLGNLWDVTDKDLDRFSVQTLHSYFDCERANKIPIGRIIAESRKVCKLPCVVGAAPVMYGLPISSCV